MKQALDLALRPQDGLVNATRVEELEHELEALKSEDEVYWMQRARAHWLQAGDMNTGYFHARASVRKGWNFISGLVNNHGDWCTTKTVKQSIVTDYFPCCLPQHCLQCMTSKRL